MKYVLVSGGVISGIGKGIIASSTGLLLQTSGLKVTMIKIDPYLNVDAGTMAPTEHGEVFVLDDGGEADLDLGNYERYLGITLTRDNNITTGKVYQHVIERERRGDYLGRTVQVVPHLTDAVQDWIERVARVPVDVSGQEPDICVIELGGTVGDIESAPFVEALRQLRRRAGKDNFAHIHVSLVPVINGEQKTKPTQHSIRDVRSIGLHPDLIACRCEDFLETSTINKIAVFCEVEPEQVVAVHDVRSTYHVPMVVEKQGLVTSLHNLLRLDSLKLPLERVEKGRRTWDAWKLLTLPQPDTMESVKIALVGKYTSFLDSYISVIKSLEHSAMACHRRLQLLPVDASHLEEQTRSSDPQNYEKAWQTVRSAAGILVPGGFGHRGTEGMIAAAKWARTEKIPYLGICLGLQIAVLESARNICGISKASSMEFEEDTPEPVITFMPEIDRVSLGGTMRLGIRPTIFQPGSEWSKLRALYGSPNTRDLTISERHRHRYEVNPSYVEILTSHGLDFVGKDDKGERMEILELKDHPWFVAVQFHPEYLSRVLEPSRPYLGFLAASSGCLPEIIERYGGGRSNDSSTAGVVI